MIHDSLYSFYFCGRKLCREEDRPILVEPNRMLHALLFCCEWAQFSNAKKLCTSARGTDFFPL